MNFAKIALASAVLSLSSVAAQAADISGAGATFPIRSTPSGPSLQGGDRHRPELPVDRFGRRHQADQGQDRDLRRHRQAAAGRGTRRSRPGAVPDGDGRHRAGRQPRGVKPGELDARRHRRSPTSSSARSRSGTTPAIEKLNPDVKLPHQRDRRRAPLGRLGHDLQLHLLPGRSRARLEAKVGVNTAVEWPVGIGAKGNEGVADNVGQTNGSIGYVEYAYAKQNKLTYAKMMNKAGKTVAPTLGRPSGRRRQRRLELAAGLRRDPRQPAGRPTLADHGRDLHPDLQEADRCRPRRPRR